MRRWLVACAVAAVAATSAPAKVVMTPPFQRECLGPATWNEVTACANRVAPGAKIVEWAKDLRVVHTPSADSFLFFERDQQWRSIYWFVDPSFELVSVTRPETTRPNLRIELSHLADIPRERRPAWLHERVAVICDRALACQARITACTVMRGGRAVETFRGTFELDANGAAVVTGDRMMTGGYCQGR